MAKLRAGVVGLRMGLNHAVGYRNNPHTDLVAVCDLSEERLQEATERVGDVATFASFDRMLAEADLDVVSVTLPNKFHAPMSVAALGAGVHTLCTKPIARTVGEGREMLAAAREADKALMVGYQRPYAAPAKHLKGLLEAGEIGDVYHVELTYLRRKCNIPPSFLDVRTSGGGPLIDLTIHILDLALWLLDTPRPLHASGMTHRRMLHHRRPESTVEDLAGALVAFEGGVSLSIRTSYEANIPTDSRLRDVTLYGAKRGVSFDPWSGEFVYGDLEGTWEEKVEDPDRKENQQEYSVDAFVDGVLAGDRMWDTVERGIVGLGILAAVYRSAESQGVSVPVAIV